MTVRTTEAEQHSTPGGPVRAVHDHNEVQEMDRKTSRRPDAKKSVAGVKALITTATIAATVGGWALFANHDGSTAALLSPKTPPQPDAPQPQQSQLSALDLSALPIIDPLPTVVPPPANLIQGGSAAQIQQLVDAPTPSPAQTASAQAPQRSLRVVTAPPAVSQRPAPRAITRSSR
jgi:hypothetical protein